MTRPNLYDILKVLALTCMIIDHVGYFFYPELIWMRRVGRIAFPVFLFLVGYNHSYKRRWSLWIRGVLVQIVLWWGVTQGIGTYGAYKGEVWLNILLAIALTRVLLSAARRVPGGVVGLSVLAILWLPYSYEMVEYGTMSVVWACIGYRVRMISARREYSVITYQIRCRGLIAMGSVGQWWITKAYFGREESLLRSSSIMIAGLVGLMIYGNRPVRVGVGLQSILLRLSRHALMLYAVHLAALYLIAVSIGR